MRFFAFRDRRRIGLASAERDGTFRGLLADEAGFPGDLDAILSSGRAALEDAHASLQAGRSVDPDAVDPLPPLQRPGKVICIGLNYKDHSKESGYDLPSYPAVFARFPSSIVAHRSPIVRPIVSPQLDYEGELVAVIGMGGRHIPAASALRHVAGYSIFNDVSVRDYQKKGAQWTIGKNFDGTGPFGPYLVTADDLPPGAKGLRLQTRLNGTVVQSASTDDLIFDVATLIATISEAITLSPGDLVVTGTPAGVGLARNPQLWLKPGDVCEVEIEGIGVLSNTVVQEGQVSAAA